MAHKDHHIKPYDEGTLNKLEIFESYVQTWIPTFIMQPHIVDHTNSLLRKLKCMKKIIYSGNTKISWKRVKQNDVVEFKWIKNGA
jgi:hypothetical protein